MTLQDLLSYCVTTELATGDLSKMFEHFFFIDPHENGYIRYIIALLRVNSNDLSKYNSLSVK